MNTRTKLGLSVAFLLSLQVTSALAFGAFAVQDSQGTSASEVGYGTGWGTTRKEAERNALKACRNVGNADCEVAVWFETCGAYVGNRVNYGIGYGDTQRAAERMAMKDCDNCKLIVSDCE